MKYRCTECDHEWVGVFENTTSTSVTLDDECPECGAEDPAHVFTNSDNLQLDSVGIVADPLPLMEFGPLSHGRGV